MRVLAIDGDAEGVVGGGGDDAEPDPRSEEGEGEEDVAGEVCAGGDAVGGVEGGEDVGGVPEDGEGELLLALDFGLEGFLRWSDLEVGKKGMARDLQSSTTTAR